jgi:hypothetical protein
MEGKEYFFHSKLEQGNYGSQNNIPKKHPSEAIVLTAIGRILFTFNVDGNQKQPPKPNLPTIGVWHVFRTSVFSQL